LKSVTLPKAVNFRKQIMRQNLRTQLLKQVKDKKDDFGKLRRNSALRARKDKWEKIEEMVMMDKELLVARPPNYKPRYLPNMPEVKMENVLQNYLKKVKKIKDKKILENP
jgi:hypothetical protein